MPEATKPTEQPHRNYGLFSDHLGIVGLEALYGRFMD
jgi:hypothetical protein